ncbi:MAG: hypothetical protein HC905_29755 [Bacteroidales bacterium]|nr:hypothetical protein [Bacteroidales bacterium]
MLFDNQSPTIQLAHNHANDSVKGGEVVIFTATFSDTNGISESNAPKITVGSLVINAAMTKSSNLVWTYQWTVPVNANETTVVSVMAQDPAGNQVTGGLNLRSFVVDNAPPVITFPTIEGKITVHVKNPAVISFSEPVRMKIANLVNAVIFREGGINGTDIPFTLSSNNLKSTGNRISFYPKAGVDALPQIIASTTLKCNTTYYLALKAGSFTDMVGNDVPLVETTFQTDPLPAKPLIAQMSSATIKNKLCLGDSIGCSNFDNTHTYKWYKDGELITESSSQYHSLANNASGKYSIYVQNSATSCENWSDTITVAMYDAVMPVVHEKRKSEVISLLIADNSSNSFVNYKWTKADGSLLTGSVTDNLQFLVLTGSNMNGEYRVNATDKNGCILKSETKAIKFKDAVANLYPTVATDYFSIDLACPENGDVFVKILNTNGVVLQKFIYSKESIFTTMQVSLGNVPVGSYLVEISIGEFREIKKVIVR